MFSKIASRYDLLNHVLSFNADRGWRRRAVRAAKLPSRGRVLDACSGTGDVAIEFARRSQQSAVVGVDLSGGMIGVGVEKTRKAGVHWVEGNVLDLPFGPGCFDAVTIAFGLRNLIHREQGIGEMARVLRSGGRLVVLEFAPPGHGLFQRVYRLYLRSVVPTIGALLSGDGGAYRYLATSVGDFLEPELVLDLMGAAGLRELCAEPLTGGIAYIYSAEK
ncbi:MAG: ubiquinone/menaquinone biosynthesis methyltransferase [Candidatus Latescibacterota bacterium]|nr:MAG: ubiquinone/menaquinone biosynthesis methyltransferase [Candidatus Latescibacterota bacterium]